MSRLVPHRFAAIGLAASAMVMAIPAGSVGAAPGGGNGNQRSNGNDGHIQIDGVPIDPGRDNDPHVGCPFTVEFFGFDPSQLATITVIPWAPTRGGSPGIFGPVPVTLHGPIPPGPGVGSTLDGYDVVTAADIEQVFSGVTPQAQQGYHARIDVELTPTPTGQGDDKHHTIWIAPCSNTTGSGETTTTTTTTSTTTTTTMVGGSSGNGGPTGPTSGGTTSVGGSSGNGAPVTLAAAGGASPVSGATTSAGGSSGNGAPVTSATTVHTGMPWAGSRPYELGSLGAGLGLVAWGLEIRRRSKPAPRTGC